METTTERAIAELLRETEAAHGAYETDVLGGVFDEDWPTWYATYLLDHGLAEHIGGARTADAESLAATLKQLAADYEREQPESPWPEVYARGLVAAYG
ncbi:MAG: hypothetical protein ACRDJC_12205 [Thermomicrobiales bacterium]